MRRIICKLFGHRWDEWRYETYHRAVIYDPEPHVEDVTLCLRNCLRCGKEASR